MILNSCFLLILVFQVYGADAVIKKKDNSLNERVEQLVDISARRPIIRLNGEKFRQYISVKGLKRNYSFVIMMTASLPHRQCQICRQAYDEFSIVANSWRFSPNFENKLFFGMIDYDEGSEIFHQLNINSAPVFFYFSEKGKIKHPEKMEIQRIGFAAETIARWIFEKSEIQIRVIRPPNYSGTLALLVLCSLIAALLYVKRNHLDFLYNRTCWAILSLSIVFAMTSGQMWNHIRGPPLMHRSQHGVLYFHGSSSGQFVVETYIVFILNASISFGIILMNEAMNGKGDYQKRKILAVLGLGLTTIFFSLLLSIFRSKARGYPYSFLFK